MIRDTSTDTNTLMVRVAMATSRTRAMLEIPGLVRVACFSILEQ